MAKRIRMATSRNVMGLALSLLLAATLSAAERKVDPTWLHRYLPDLPAKAADLTTDTCRYQPIFGEGDEASHIVKTVARFGQVTVDPHGSCAPVQYPREEQIYVVVEGNGVVHYGDQEAPIRKNDFMYLAPTVTHSISNSSDQPCRVVVMGFKIPAETTLFAPSPLSLANMDDVKLQTVGGHPESVLYRLLVGDRSSTRDKIAAGYVVTSLFLMEFAPRGTNFPHHHETAEEIYLVLDGRGKMVAGGGMDGIEGLHPAAAGDAYFFRQNCTVGFYSSDDPSPKARILAVRSRLPFTKHEE